MTTEDIVTPKSADSIIRSLRYFSLGLQVLPYGQTLFPSGYLEARLP
ncbi:MAG: hypothetical protein SO135_02885 [Sphaerochaetaceae bacterium]|nr:hypothetical protein [Sphaerochaetaceae bacterium]NLY06971.1 hypothetical protein [Spirochaetales bacterium]